MRAMQRNFEALSKSHQSILLKSNNAEKEVKMVQKMKVEIGEERKKLESETSKVVKDAK